MITLLRNYKPSQENEDHFEKTSLQIGLLVLKSLVKQLHGTR